MPRLVSVDDSFNLPAAVNVVDDNLPARLGAGELNATYATAASVTPKLDKTEALASYVPKRGARVALLGDSITAANYPSAGDIGANGYFSWANILLRNRITPIFDTDGLMFGYAGITAAQLLSTGEAAACAASAADIVVEMSGTNDFTAGATPAQIAANRLAIWQLQLAKGKTVVACTILPRWDDPTVAPKTRETNRLIRKNAEATPGVVLCDWYATMVDPANGLGATKYLRTDGLHINAPAASRIGKVLADTLETILPKFGDADLPTANGEGLINNSLMLGTAGTFFGNNTGYGTANGVVADGWTLGNSGTEGGVITGAKVARTDFWPGEWQQVTLATPPLPKSSRMWLRGQSTGLAGAAIGDKIYAAIEFETVAANWDIRHISATLTFVGGTGSPSALSLPDAYLQAQDIPLERPAAGVIKTVPKAIPAGTTSVQLIINMFGAGTFKFGRTGVFKAIP